MVIKLIKNRDLYAALLIVIFSFFNFNYNLFYVVSDERFDYFQVESEQFVLDGYLNYKLNQADLKLGQFTRPSIDMFNEGEKYKPRQWYFNNFIEGEFWEYKSHFGLQLLIFDFFNGDLRLVQTLASLLLSLVLGSIFYILSKIISFQFSLVLILSIAFNPWITPIARNSYFLLFIYFIPFLVSLLFVKKINLKRSQLIKMLIVLYFIFLIKSLIGYDYLSTIVLISMIPIVFFAMKNRRPLIELVRNLSLILIVSFFSFFTAILIHSNSLKSEKNPLEWIYYVGAKRLSSSDPQTTAYETCYQLLSNEDGSFDIKNPGNKQCIESLIESLSVSRIEVLGKYFIARHTLPFLGSFDIKLTENQESDLKDIYYDSNLSFFTKAYYTLKYYLNNYREFNIFQVISVIINFIFSPIIFILLFILYGIKTLNAEKRNQFFNFFMILPPISWFILAKGHSYVTAYQLTFFIWFIFTIPYMIAYLTYRKGIFDN
jgi:hypothetical protein